ncbi:MAG: hypothetical protein ABI611_05825 [Solirubrobacteraceae bacterium]
MARTSPDPATFTPAPASADWGDFATMTSSGSGDVTAPVTPVGPLNVPIGSTPAGTTASGCAASDFAGFPAGDIVLVPRGTFTFGEKVAKVARSQRRAAKLGRGVSRDETARR